MLTKITLDGAMGKKFGRTWNLQVSSPAEAVSIIDANMPEFRTWIREQAGKYSTYKVSCAYEGGRKEDIGEESFATQGRLTSIRFTPIIEGRGSAAKIVIGAVLMWYSDGKVGYQWMMGVGVSLVMTGVIGLLSPQPLSQNAMARQDKTSYFFDGPVNTTAQGVPVPLIYGRILTGSHAISAKMDISDVIQ